MEPVSSIAVRALAFASVVLAFGATGSVAAADPHPTPEDPSGHAFLGCPQPLNEFDRPQTITDAAAVFMLLEALTLCDGETITHGEDRDLQKRLRLQEMIEKIDRQRAREARRAARAATPAATYWDSPPRG